ncbi:unnamed protein product [Cunninghamella blakesleeana]
MMPPSPEFSNISFTSTSSTIPSSIPSNPIVEGEFIILDTPTPSSNTAVFDNNNNTIIQEEQQVYKLKPNHYMLPSIDFFQPMGHHFDTYALVERLHTDGGFTRDQARVIMEIMQYQIRDRVYYANKELLPKTQLENETQVLDASIDDLKNNVSVKRRNDAAFLNAELRTLSRDIENLELQLNEDIHYLQSSIDLTLNDFRADIRQEPKLNLLEAQEANHRLTVLLADANMSLERMKWETIWQSLCKLLLLLLLSYNTKK